LPELADHLVAAICDRFGVRRKTIAAAALELLARYDWARNNVRELRNVVERMVIDSDADVIGPEHVPPELVSSTPATSRNGEARTFVEQKAEAERQIIISALERNDWHVTRTAQELGLADHASLLKIMRRHGVSRR
jgi:two-component system nitrogen regulation response regulator NtrX